MTRSCRRDGVDPAQMAILGSETPKEPLVGVQAESVKDYVSTPFNRLEHGVIAHAHIVDQIIRAARDGDQPIRVWSRWSESAFIVGCGVIAGLLAFLSRSAAALVLSLLSGAAVIAFVAYQGFAHGVWIPAVPGALAWFAAGVGVMTYLRYEYATMRITESRAGVPTRYDADAHPSVFISAKSQDYPSARQIYEFLDQAGVDTFFSEVSLQVMGEADFRRRIDKVLDQVKHMIVVYSSAENVSTSWVEAEWGFFVNEKRSGRKSGNIITVTVGEVSPAELPPALRQSQIIELEPRNLPILLSYVDH